MADGDLLQHEVARGTASTTDATETTVASIAIASVATDSMIVFHGWCVAYETGQTDPKYNHFQGLAKTDASALSVVDFRLTDPDDASDPDDNKAPFSDLSWTVTVDASGSDLRVRVTGGATDTVRWYSEMNAHVVEVAISGA